jgi:ABC-type uncharacterized transport system permease subunit
VMQKYWHVINIGIQNTLVYRINFLFRSVFGLIPLLATLSLWRAVYAGKAADDVAGYVGDGHLNVPRSRRFAQTHTPDSST